MKWRGWVCHWLFGAFHISGGEMFAPVEFVELGRTSGEIG